MKFGDKLRQKRHERGLSQPQLAKELGVALRTIANYETGQTYPKTRDFYYKLADFFDVDKNYFLTEDEEFITLAAEQYGSKGITEASMILEQTSALFAGGKLSDEAQLAFLHQMQEIYFMAKKDAKEKFTPKKYRKPQSEE